jgi:hypothetical protein
MSANNIDTAMMESLKVLDPERPIREADIVRPPNHVRFVPPMCDMKSAPQMTEAAWNRQSADEA